MCAHYVFVQRSWFLVFRKLHFDNNLHKNHQGGKEYRLAGLTPVSTDLVLSGSWEPGLGLKGCTLPSRSIKRDDHLWHDFTQSVAGLWLSSVKDTQGMKLLFLVCRSESEGSRPHKRSTEVSTKEWADFSLISITGGRTFPKSSWVLRKK